MIFFESPRRTADTLTAFRDALGPERPAAVCRELTKTYEEVKRGNLAELAAWAAESEILGEITIVIAGAPERVPVDLSDPSAVDDVAALVARVQSLVDAGERLKDAVATVAGQSGVNKRGLYDAAIKARAE